MHSYTQKHSMIRDRSFSYTRNYFTTHGNRKREVAVNWSSGEKPAHRVFVVWSRLIYHSICLTHLEELLRAFLLFFDRYKLLIISLNINRLPRLLTHMSSTMSPLLNESRSVVCVTESLMTWSDWIFRIFSDSFCFCQKQNNGEVEESWNSRWL